MLFRQWKIMLVINNKRRWCCDVVSFGQRRKKHVIPQLLLGTSSKFLLMCTAVLKYFFNEIKFENFTHNNHNLTSKVKGIAYCNFLLMQLRIEFTQDIKKPLFYIYVYLLVLLSNQRVSKLSASKTAGVKLELQTKINRYTLKHTTGVKQYF